MSLLAKLSTMNRASATIGMNALRSFSARPTPIVSPNPFPMPNQPRQHNKTNNEVVLQPLLGMKLDSPFAYTAVPSTVTVNPRYEIFESMTAFQVNMEIPEGLDDPQAHLQIKVNEDAKAIQVSGLQDGSSKNGGKAIVFDKHFSTGRPLDLIHMHAAVADGKLTISAPKVSVL